MEHLRFKMHKIYTEIIPAFCIGKLTKEHFVEIEDEEEITSFSLDHKDGVSKHGDFILLVNNKYKFFMSKHTMKEFMLKYNIFEGGSFDQKLIFCVPDKKSFWSNKEPFVLVSDSEDHKKVKAYMERLQLPIITNFITSKIYTTADNISFIYLKDQFGYQVNPKSLNVETLKSHFTSSNNYWCHNSHFHHRNDQCVEHIGKYSFVQENILDGIYKDIIEYYCLKNQKEPTTSWYKPTIERISFEKFLVTNSNLEVFE